MTNQMQKMCYYQFGTAHEYVHSRITQ